SAWTAAAAEEDRVKTSKDRILTTHTGSLPRPKPLVDLVLAREQGGAANAAAFEAETAKAVEEVVARQIAAGIDVVSDGEMSKPPSTPYRGHRVAGFFITFWRRGYGEGVLPSLPGLPRQSIQLRNKIFAKKMDARVKPAHDACGPRRKVDHLIASGLVGDPTAPVIGIAGATNMNS